MADYQVIQLATDGSCRWLVVDSEGTRKSEISEGSLANASAASNGLPVIALVPAEDTLTVTTELQARGARLMNALPFALEDQVADDVEDLHFAPGKRLPDGRLPVAVIARERLADWLERLDEAGIKAARLVPEDSGLPPMPNTLSLMIDGDRTMFNDGRGLSFSLEGARPTEVLAAAGYIERDDEDSDSPTALQVYCDPSAEERFATDWAALRHELDAVEIRVLPEGALPRLAVAIAGGAGINLLAGQYAEKTNVAEMFKPWRLVASLVVGLLLVGFAGKVADYISLGAEEAALKAQFSDVYRQLRPSDNREILDPVGTVRSVERSLGGGSGPVSLFLPTLQQLSAAVSASGDAQIEAISYRAGVFDVRMTVPDVATLDRIQQSVNASSQFTATIQSTSQSGDGINGRLQIREAGA